MTSETTQAVDYTELERLMLLAADVDGPDCDMSDAECFDLLTDLRDVLMLLGSDPEDVARKIAALSDLLAALREAEKYALVCGPDDFGNYPLKQIRAAIAKATP